MYSVQQLTTNHLVMYTVVVYVTLHHSTHLTRTLSHCYLMLHLFTEMFCKFRKKFPVDFSKSQNTKDTGSQGRWWHLLEKSGVCGLQTIIPDPGIFPHTKEVRYRLRGDAGVLLQAGVGPPQFFPQSLVTQSQLVLTLLTEKCLKDIHEESFLVLFRHLLLDLGMTQDLSLIIIQVGGNFERMNENKKSEIGEFSQ